MPERQLAIAGGGASGTLLAHALVRAGARVTIVEPRAALGVGLAYSTSCPLHLLNAPAGRMSAFADDPDHFLRWLAAHGEPAVPTAFLSRARYGAYLASIAGEVRDLGGERFRHLRSRVVDAAPGAGMVSVRTADGAAFGADVLVVAVGNAKPAPWPLVPADVRSGGSFFASAWHDEATTPARPDESVVLLGTGLTAVDAVLGLRHNGHRGPIVMVSRRGLLPHEHRQLDRPPADAPFATSLGEVIASVRRSRTGNESDWRSIIDGLRHEINVRWEALDLSEQRRFVRHVLPYWNVHRHRMAPEAAKAIALLFADGTLRMIAGRTQRLEAIPGGVRVPIALRGRDETIVVDAQRVINCSGPEHDVSARTNPLLRSLLASGAMDPNPLRIGARIASDGALIGVDGTPSERLFALGPVRYGTLIETTAIPEIREQVRDLAQRLLAGNVTSMLR
jgi:uncharacterized NAD(P)/FAD-binding protein YdhS